MQRTEGRHPNDRLVWVAAVLVAILVLPWPAVPGTTGASPPAPASNVAPAAPASAAPRHLLRDLARPAQGDLWYLQEGVSFGQVNGTYSIGSVRTLSETVRLVTSPYPTAYELNGISEAGDWYQITAAYNWGGCGSDVFAELYEIWNRTQYSEIGPTCDGTVDLSRGDSVQLLLTFDSAKQACLGLDDLTTGHSRNLCFAQPDSGGLDYVLVPYGPQNHYDTGAWTEVADPDYSSCPSYSKMPTVTFTLPSWVGLTSFTPWSDEFDLDGSLCYWDEGNTVTLAPGDISSHDTELASSSSYGPHWIEGQNESLLESGVGFRCQTDPVPIGNASISASTYSDIVGHPVELSASGSGGVGPYTAVWTLNGSIYGPRSTSWNWTPAGDGRYTFQAAAIDAQGDVSMFSEPVSIVAFVPLSAGSVRSANGLGADVGQRVTFSVNASGGSGRRTFAWTGLPGGCTSSDGSTLNCTPTVPGWADVGVTVTDASGGRALAAVLPFRVSPALLPNVSASRMAADVGQNATLAASASGGSGGYRYAWSGLPPGCASTAAAVACNFTTPGTYPVAVAATDSNRFTQAAVPLSLAVFPDPTVRFGMDRTTLDADQWVNLTAQASLGSGGFTYAWVGIPSGCTQSAAELDCLPTAGGLFVVAVQATDSDGVTAVSNASLLTVAPELTANASVSPLRPLTGEVVSFFATPDAGTPPVTETWTFGDGSQSSGSTASHAFGSPGSYTVRLWVNDSVGASLRRTFVVNVTSPSTGSVFLGLPSMEGYALVLVIAVLVAAGALALARRGGGTAPPGRPVPVRGVPRPPRPAGGAPSDGGRAPVGSRTPAAPPGPPSDSPPPESRTPPRPNE
jgi:hypothetical protein